MKNISKMLKRILPIALALGAVVPPSQVLSQSGAWSLKASMLTARHGHAAGVVSGVVYAIGGFNSSGALATVEAYDPATDSWSSRVSMPTARGNFALGVVNGIVYVAGGANGSSFLTTVEAYNPDMDTWTTKAPLPIPIAQSAGGVANGVFYVVGGVTTSPGELSAVFAYNPQTNSWTTRASMANTRNAAAVSVVGGSLHVVGGSHTGGFVLPVETYDPITDTWRQGAPMPTGRYNLAAVEMNGFVYAIGGYDNGDLATVEAYDPVADAWLTKPSMLVARQHPAAALVNGALYVAGGHSGVVNLICNGCGPVSSTEAFTPARHIQPSLASANFFGGSGDQRATGVSIQGSAIYVTGNVGPGTQSPNDTALVLEYPAPPSSSPVWSKLFDFGTNLFGVAASSEGVYAAGWNYSLSSDSAGGKEVKSIMAKFAPDGGSGSGPGGSTWARTPNFFSYSGVESHEAVTTAVESGSNFIYATGFGQPCSYSAYALVKYDASGSVLGAATDSSVGVNFGSCFVPSPGGSDGGGIAVLSGNIYVAGVSAWSHEGDNQNNRPTLWKYGPTPSFVWRRKDTSLDGVFQGVAGLRDAVYGVGFSYTPGAPNSENFLIEKYDEAGNLLWSKVSGGSNTDVLTGAVGIGNRLFAVGYTRSMGSGGADAVILEIDTVTGGALSTTLYGGALDDIASGAATDGVDLYVVGESRSFASAAGNAVGQDDVMLLRYSLSPDNNAPVVICRNVTVAAGPDCVADASIDNGSFDPDGDALTISQTPPGPYPLGSTPVVLTVIDSSGASSRCNATVTVVDTTPPTITRPADIAVTAPLGHGSIEVVYQAPTVTDNCAAASVVCSPPSGLSFPLGTTAVVCSATDASNNVVNCSFTITVAAPRMTALGPAKLWLGLKNSDDVGTKFDLLAEVFKNGALVGSGQLNGVPGAGSGFNNAVARVIDLALSSPVSCSPGDSLSIALSLRIGIGVAGHRSGTARLWFNDAVADSRFDVTIGGETRSYYLTSGFVLSRTPGLGPKNTIDIFVDRAVNGNPFKPFGAWGLVF